MVRIGILAHLDVGNYHLSPGKEQLCLNQDYITTIAQAGGVPLIIPIVKEGGIIDSQLDAIDGILLSGGQDVSPHHYHEEPIRQLGELCPERDEFEIHLIQKALKRNIPLLAICRGMQILNVALGGSLFQDIPHQTSSPLQHSQLAKGHFAGHSVELIQGSLLHKILNEPRITVNSFHHQAINKLAPNLQINAKAPDGMIEGVEMATAQWVIGVQWHPERMVDHHPVMMRLFQAFVKAAGQPRT